MSATATSGTGTDDRAGDGTAYCDYAADELVARGDADDDAAFAPGVPFVDVPVGPADAGMRDRYQHLPWANAGNGRVGLQP